MTAAFAIWALGVMFFLILWEAHIKAHPEAKPWSSMRIFGAWLVLMLWPFLLLYLLLSALIRRIK